jgi:hypothetical protein
MKKERKKREFDDRSKRLLLYLSLLIAAVFLGIYNPEGLWLAIGLGAGILYGLLSDWVFSRRGKAENANKLSTEKSETVENKTADGRDESQDKN